MNRQRAEDIAASPEMKHVTYNGKRIYIKHVNEQSETAHVVSLHDPQEAFDVQLTNLYEK
ncbi:H-type small acid-soluble spore protein [Virgibacillus sp. C22-A2]|uniref:Small, acid-soluble spore protein H n=1 Tax=Virgibacillus tibetensis TaxID=3042313 RepID=A0ABU6KFH2_9BACI|nr:H-type small acid-soluble spore protein [Virgibacillus sp. C22-A2]